MSKVSVIIPVYNVEQYIEECLTSALRQTLQDIEVICVDDGSPDGSMEIVERYARSDGRIQIVRKENGGLSSARNAGLDAATGEYVYFLDSDDYIADDMLMTLYTESKKQDLDNIYFDAEAFYESPELEQKFPVYKDYYRRPGLFGEVVSGPELFARMENLIYYRPSACLQMPRRSLLIENGIRFYEGIVHEDQLFSAQVILLAKRAKHMAVPFYKRRVREGSTMTDDQAFKRSYGYYVCLREYNRFLSGFDFQDELLQKAIFHRCYVMQNNAAKEVKGLKAEELDAALAACSFEDRLAYTQLVRRPLDERLSQERKQKEIREKEQKKLKKIKDSYAYRVGNGLTKYPAKAYHAGVNLRQKGAACTLYSIRRKLTGEKRELHPDRICVSVIIPMYNAEKYLRECLDRLIRQTLSSIEIVCVNDGSTDSTPDILAEYAAKDSRIKVVHQKNQGAGIARNHGMQEASGEYFLFLDADDIFHERLCEETYYKAKYEMADIVLFEAWRLDMKTNRKEEMNWVLRMRYLPDVIPFSSRSVPGHIFQVTTACPWSKLFRAEFVRKQGLQFQNTKNANDVFFVRCALALAKRITVLEKRLITYRYNDGSNIQSGKAKAPLEFYKAFCALKKELEKRGVYRRVEKSYVNMALDESLFNMETAGSPEASKAVEQKLLEEGFAFFGIDRCDPSWFYSESNYRKYLEMTGSKGGK